MSLSKNEENQLLQFFQGQTQDEKPVTMMQTMTLTVPVVKQRMIEQTPLGFRPIQ